MFYLLLQTIKKRLSDKNGFTLIEVIVVLFIVIIMASLAMTGIRGTIASGKKSAEISESGENKNANSADWSSFDSIYVKDSANMMSDPAKRKIHELSSRLDKKAKAQIVVMTVASLNDVPIQDYSLTKFRELSIGDKDLNNGILILVSKTDRKLRVEIGYGLEGAINDDKAGNIVREKMIPAFKKDKYETGIMNGYLAIAEEANKEYKSAMRGGSNGGGGIQESW